MPAPLWAQRGRGGTPGPNDYTILSRTAPVNS